MTTLDFAADRSLASDSERLAQRIRLLCVLFFFSGFPALIYQLVWQRALFRIFGVNIELVTIVVTAFMLGLGLGSLAGGWLSKRRVPLLLLLAVIEVLTAAFGLFSLAIFDKVAGIAAALPLAAAATLALGAGDRADAPDGRHPADPGRIPGAPLRQRRKRRWTALLRQHARGRRRVFRRHHRAVSVPRHAGRRERRGRPECGGRARRARGPCGRAPRDRHRPKRRPGPSRTPVLRFAPAMALACIGGFVSLSYEIFLFRVMSYATGSSATAFAATLGAFLIGIAVGSRQAGRNCEASRDDVVARMVLDVMIANLAGALFLPILGLLSWLGGAVAGMALLMTYLVARYWGSFLPYLAELGIVPDAGAGMRTALIYLANIVGAASGSIVTGFVLMDVLTLTGIAGWLVAIGLACAILLFAVLPVARQRKHTLAVATAGFGLIALLATPAVNADILEHLQQKGFGQQPLVQVVENRSGIITVDRAGTVFGNGMYDGKFTTDLVHDTNGIVRPYALSLFHPAPRDVLMIGLSSGSWAQVIANNPAVNSLTIIEINPGYVAARRAGGRSRLGARASEGHDHHRRRPPLAASQ